jgi:hypothetical protein
MEPPRPPTHEKISHGARHEATITSKMVESANKEEPHPMVFPLLPHHHNGTYKKLKLQEQDLQVT